MKKLMFLLVLILLIPSAAGITLNLNATFSEPILLPNESYLLNINLTLDSNVIGENLLLINVIYDSGKGWNCLDYSASINGKTMIFNVSEADVNVFGVLKHRITFANSSLNITQPTSILLNISLKTPEVNSGSYTIDVIALWSYPGLNVTEIKNVSLNIFVGAPDLIVESIEVPSNMVAGKPYTIRVSVKNIGNANATAFKVSLKANGYYIGNRTISSLNISETKEVEFIWTPSAGRYTLTAEVDPDNAVKELNETNNIKSVSVSVATVQQITRPKVPIGGGIGGGGYVITPTPIPTPTPTPKPTPVITLTPTPTPTVTPTPTPTPTETLKPTPTPEPWWKIPGFELVYALTALLTLAYILRKVQN